MQNTKVSINKKSFIIAVADSLLLLAFLIFQIVNGKYQDNYVLIWSWFFVVAIPILVITAYLYFSPLHFQLRFSTQTLAMVRNFVYVYFGLVLLTLVVVIPVSWIVGGIGYRPIFLSTMAIAGIVQFSVFFLLRRSMAKQKVDPGLLQQQQLPTNTSNPEMGSNAAFQKVLSRSKALIGEGDTLEAIKVLEQFFTEQSMEVPSDLILLKNNLLQTQKELDLGLIDFNNSKLMFNRINNSLLNYMASFRD